MNQKRNKELKKLLSSMHMGNSILRISVDKTKSEELKNKIIKYIKTFEAHELKIMEIAKKSGDSVNDSLDIIQEMSVNFQVMAMPKNDFKISVDLLKGMNMAVIGILNFIYLTKENIDDELKEYLISIIKDYDKYMEDVHNYVLEHYS